MVSVVKPEGLAGGFRPWKPELVLLLLQYLVIPPSSCAHVVTYPEKGRKPLSQRSRSLLEKTVKTLSSIVFLFTNYRLCCLLRSSYL